MKQIDHDPDEPPRDRSGNGVLWMAGLMVSLLWLGSLTLLTLDWHSVTLGAVTGGVFVAIMTEITGNKVPPWMRR
jgi:hypothetical protein